MPTGKMWCDVLTTPKQGKGFWVDRSNLMNVAEDYDDAAEAIQMHPDLLPTTPSPMKVRDAWQPDLHFRSALRHDISNSGLEFNYACLKGSAVLSLDVEYKTVDIKGRTSRILRWRVQIYCAGSGQEF